MSSFRTARRLSRPRRLPGGVLVALALFALTATASARGSRAVVIVRPDASTCIDPDALAAAMANAGAILPSVVPEDMARDVPSDAVVFRIESGEAVLRIRGWGLKLESQEGLADWPAPWPERAADLDRVIPAPGCETATEAVVAFLISVLAPTAPAELPPEVRTDRGSKLASVLELASAELAQRSHLTAGVLNTELGLTFIVEDVHASCRRGTWLDLRGEQPRMGQTVAELERDVQACLRQRELDERRRGLNPSRRQPEAAEPRSPLPAATGAVVAALGVLSGYVAVKSYDNPGPVLALTTMPAVAGGAAGYFASGRGRDALWLAGYWSAVAGSSMVAAAQSGSAKPVLVGSFIAGGAVTSAAMVALDALRTEGDGMPGWAVSLPAASGAVLGWAGLFVSGNTRNSIEIAAIGGFAALLPAFWMALSPDPRADAGAASASLGVSLEAGGARLQLRGEL